jgi:DNA replication protein DnaC
LAQAIRQAVITQGYLVIYREAHVLLEEIADAALDGKRKEHMELLATVPLLIIDDLGMRKLGPTAAEELLEIVVRRYERASTLLTSNRPVEDWGKLTARRQRRRHRYARPPAAPRPSPQMWPTQLADQNGRVETLGRS